MQNKRIMIVAGEASGDIYGAEVATHARAIDPALSFFGIGGERMREAGIDTLVDSADMAVVGFVEVFKHFDVIAAAFLKLKKIIKENPPALILLIDYPGFNLRLAKVAKKAGIPVLYYISPQIWAWRQGRVKKIAKLVDHMAVILPFEAQYYEKERIPVTFVGHPMHDIVKVSSSRDEAATALGLDPAKKIVGLFPGSRKNELEKMLPTICNSASMLQQQHPDIQFVLPVASTLKEKDINDQLVMANLKPLITKNNIHQVIRASDAIIAVSGTVTLEIALVGTPMVIIYKLSPMTYQIAKRLVKIDYIGICNIIAGEKVAEELIQDDASPEKISSEIARILEQQDYSDSIKAKLAAVRGRLGKGGASSNVANILVNMLQEQR